MRAFLLIVPLFFALTLRFPCETEAREAPAVQFQQDSLRTQDGHVKLVWRVPAADDGPLWRYEVQVDSSAQFSQPTQLYRGPDLATFVSGLPNGEYYYRIRVVGPQVDQPGRWDQAYVHVEHHSLNLALTIASIGSIVFILTVIVVLRGAYRSEQLADDQ